MKMKNISTYRIAFLSLALLGVLSLAACQSMMHTMGMGPPMGSAEDVADSQALWQALERAQLVGAQAGKTKLHMSAPPHGKITETLRQPITVNGHTGLAIVKYNHNGPDISLDKVEADRAKYLKAVTVMYKREMGYDSENKDWFWAKYTPDGGLDVVKKMGMNIKLAGRVAKGMEEGCISCHKNAPGGDFVFINGAQTP